MKVQMTSNPRKRILKGRNHEKQEASGRQRADSVQSEKLTEQKEVLTSLLDLFLDTHEEESNCDAEDEIPEMKQEMVEQIESFLMQLSSCYQNYGCPTHTIEVTMAKVAKGLGLDAHFIVFPSHTVFELSTVKTDKGLYRKRSQFFRTSFGYNFYKLQLVDELARRISAYAMDSDTEAPEVASTSAGKAATTIDQVMERARALSNAVSPPMPDPNYHYHPSPALSSGSSSKPLYGSVSHPDQSATAANNGNQVQQEAEDGEKAPAEFHRLLPPLHAEAATADSEQSEDTPFVDKLGRTILELASLGPNVYAVTDASSAAEIDRAKTYRTLFARLALEDGIALVRAIIKKRPLYSDLFKSFLLGVASFGCCGMFFGGGWADMCVALPLGIIVSRIESIFYASPSFSRIYEFVATFAVSIIIRIINQYWVGLCYRAVLMSAIVFSLQGVTITMSFIDLMTRDLITGTTRLFYGMLISAMVGFAMDLSTSTYASLAGQTYEDVITNNNCDASRLIDPIWYPLLFITTSMSFNILTESHPKQLWVMEIICAFSYAVYYFTARSLKNELPPMLAAFTAGVLANVYCRNTGHPAVVYIIPAVFLLVPGSVAASSFFNVFTEDVTGGMDLAFTVVTGSLSIAIGLFAASAVVPLPDGVEPLKDPNSLYPGTKSVLTL